MTSNRILPFLAGLVLLMLLIVGVKSCGSDSDQAVGLTEVPTPGTPDADSPADTIRTLTAEVAALKSENQKIQLQNEEFLRQREEITNQVKKEMAEIQQNNEERQSSAVSALTQQLDYFKARLDELTQTQNQSVAGQAGDIPIGFGLGAGESMIDAQPDAMDVVWVEPLGTRTDDQGKPVYIPTQALDAGGLLDKGKATVSDTEKYLHGELDALEEKDTPAYTVPRNATLIGSTGMTALIGRIPIDGTVQDPFPFKVIVGKDNLAGNGIDMPGLDGMIFSGKATGDWTLSCVRGQVYSVTYVFADGTIRTLSSDTQSQKLPQLAQSSGSDSSGNGQRSLGWISDRRGIPCVTGVRISNAATYLGGRILAAGADAAAGAFAQSQTTNVVSPVLGTTTSVITGDAGKYAAGQALSGGAEEVSAYLRERLAQSFDVIYVDTGSELAIHVDVELPIDYEHNGRKTTYAQSEYTDRYWLD